MVGFKVAAAVIKDSFKRYQKDRNDKTLVIFWPKQLSG